LLQEASSFTCVDLPGLEPRKPEPKTGVLPLHHRSIPNCVAKVRPCSQKIKHRSKKNELFIQASTEHLSIKELIRPIPSMTQVHLHESFLLSLAIPFLDHIQ
jgi:hypothetical protein